MAHKTAERQVSTIEGGRDWGAFIPSFLDDYGLDPYQFRVYCRLARRAGMNGACWESHSNMAEELKMSRSSVIRSLRFLEELGMIRRSKPKKNYGDGGTIRYELTHQNNWKDLNATVLEQGCVSQEQGCVSQEQGCVSQEHKGIPIRQSLKVSPLRTETLRIADAEQSSEGETASSDRLTLEENGFTSENEKEFVSIVRQQVKRWLKDQGVKQMSTFHRNLISAHPKAAKCAIEELIEWVEDGEDPDSPAAALTDRIHFYAKLGKYAPNKSKKVESPQKEAKPAIVPKSEPVEVTPEPEPIPYPMCFISGTLSGQKSIAALLRSQYAYVSVGAGYWRLATFDRVKKKIVSLESGKEIKLDPDWLQVCTIEQAASDQNWTLPVLTTYR